MSFSGSDPASILLLDSVLRLRFYCSFAVWLRSPVLILLRFYCLVPFSGSTEVFLFGTVSPVLILLRFYCLVSFSGSGSTAVLLLGVVLLF